MQLEELAAYTTILHYIVNTGGHPVNDDDVKDAIVDLLCNEEHVTDESLETSLRHFREIENTIEEVVQRALGE